MFFSKKPKNAEGKLIIGAVEYISLPDLGIKKLKARIDTGAKISALHADNIKLKKIDGKRFVHFDIIVGEWGAFTSIPAKAPLKDVKTVVSSNGHYTKRPVIVTRIKVGNLVWKIHLSLIDRSAMRYRMLLGRLSIKNRFVVDVSGSHFQS